MKLRTGLLATLALALPTMAAQAQTQPRPAPQPRVQAAPRATAPAAAPATTSTLQQALAVTYATNPALQAARAQLRATDENVPQALAGWRPQVSITGSVGYSDQANITQLADDVRRHVNVSRSLNSQSLTVTQPVYRGGATRANTNRAENQVLAQRATLIQSEQQILGNAVLAYVNLIQAQQVLGLNINNVQVLTRQLQATQDRFRVGEITRTDVAQAEASLASAQATLATSQGNLQTARATYKQVIGDVPDRLIEPQPLQPGGATLDQVKSLALVNNPAVLIALYNNAAAKDNFDVQFTKLMPNLSVQGQVARNDNTQTKNLTTQFAQVLLQASMPLYQGGSEYSAIRQARQQQQQTQKSLDDARNVAIQNVTSSWQTYEALKATIASTRQAIASNEIALEGVQREAIVGSRTTLDVLNAEQTLLNSRVTLVQNLAQLVTASYQVAASVGRLTARDLALAVPLYDDHAYYEQVRNRWAGTGDFATDQPGR